jgi:LacI family transcriptional regulator
LLQRSVILTCKTASLFSSPADVTCGAARRAQHPKRFDAIIWKAKHVNLKQLSQLLGLSQTTVSRALNGYPEVNAETRQRVLDAVRDDGLPTQPRRPEACHRPRRLDRPGHADGADGIESDVHFGEFLAGLGDEAVRHDFHFVINRRATRTTRSRDLPQAGGKRQCRCALPRLYAEKDPRIAMMKLAEDAVRRARPTLDRARATIPYLDIDNHGAFYDARAC